jgi:hypothetical protein
MSNEKRHPSRSGRIKKTKKNLESMATREPYPKKDEKRHPSRSGRIKKTRKKLESTATERALSKKDVWKI